MGRPPTRAPSAPPDPITPRPKSGRAERLRQARLGAGYGRGSEAVERFGWNRNTYKSNENGAAPFSFDQAKAYARAFGVGAEWLYDGEGPMHPGDAVLAPPARRAPTTPVVGYVSAGARATLFAEGQGPLGHVSAPEDASESTVAVEIRGDSLGALFNEWLVFYDDVRSPVTPDLHGRLCVVGLADGRVLIKQLRPSRTLGLYHLYSQTEEPILDQEILWAAAVTGMRPR
jgi:hypothetical protein